MPIGNQPSLLFAATLLALMTHPAAAETYGVSPPGSASEDNATRNLVDVIDTIRKGGLEKEAGQLRGLLGNRQVYYRTSGANKYDAQFIHDLTSDDDDKLYFGVQHVGYADNEGAQRYTGVEGSRRRYLTVLVALHELVHKDQGAPSVGTSSMLADSRGYALHEIEALRVSMKKFADIWVTGDIERYLQARSAMTSDKDYETLSGLRHRLFALRNSLGGPVGKGDKACRWTAITAQADKLGNMLDALWLDQGSRRSCRNNQDNSAMHRQAAIEIKLKFDALGTEMKTAKTELDGIAADYEIGRKEYSELRSELENPSTATNVRQDLANRLGPLGAHLDNLRERHNRLVREYNEDVARRKSLRAEYDQAVAKQKPEAANFDQCRIDYVRERMIKFKLSASQLPPDMVKVSDSEITLAAEDKKRPMDLAELNATLKDMFAYDIKLLTVTEAATGDDPRTPCYIPKPTAAVPAENQAKPKVKCTGGGLIGRMNCVTEHIEQGQ